MSDEHSLPAEIVSKANFLGNEYAWPIDEIPAVIEAARKNGLINIGGQLQFRIPNGGTCECYWIEVDTYKHVSRTLPHRERVERAATSALEEFNRLRTEMDFASEGRKAFREVGDFETRGGNINEAMCFVWYVTVDD